MYLKGAETERNSPSTVDFPNACNSWSEPDQIQEPRTESPCAICKAVSDLSIWIVCCCLLECMATGSLSCNGSQASTTSTPRWVAGFSKQHLCWYTQHLCGDIFIWLPSGIHSRRKGGHLEFFAAQCWKTNGTLLQCILRCLCVLHVCFKFKIKRITRVIVVFVSVNILFQYYDLCWVIIYVTK